jgi:hypothetical protein
MYSHQSFPYSIYIPRVANYYSRGDIELYMKLFGQVARIDLIYLGQQPGFIHEEATTFNSAFIHFSNMNMEKDHVRVLIDTLEQGKSCKWPVTGNQYWVLLKTQNPVPSTLMNIEQVTDNCRYLEQKIQVLTAKNMVNEERIEYQNGKILSQSEDIKMLLETVREQSNTIERLQDTVYKVIGKVFNKETEMDQIYGSINMMYHGNPLNTIWAIDKEDDGSDNYVERHAQKLLQENMKLYQENNYDNDNDDSLTISSHSSMPSLVSITSDENEGEYQVPIISDDEESSESTTTLTKRMRNSFDICGNN